MHLPATRRRLGFLGTLALVLAPLASHSQACLIPWTGGYGYSSYYAPSAYGYGYTANYGGYGGGCCGLFGYGSYYANYAPAYQYAPSYSAPCRDPCGGACGSCGSCGTWGGYALGGNCGSCVSGDCGISSTTPPSGSPTPYSGQPVTPPTSPPGSNAPPQTYREPGDDGFRQPQPIPGTGGGGGGGGGGLFPPQDGAGGSSIEASPSNVAPAGGAAPDSQIERDGGSPFESYKIPARDAETGEPAGDVEDEAEESRVIVPLQIDAVATSVTPQRRRAHYRAIFRTPSVARTQVPVESGWEAVLDVPTLANAEQ